MIYVIVILLVVRSLGAVATTSLQYEFIVPAFSSKNSKSKHSKLKSQNARPKKTGKKKYRVTVECREHCPGGGGSYCCWIFIYNLENFFRNGLPDPHNS